MKARTKKSKLNGTLTMAGFLVIVSLAAGSVYTASADLRDKERSYIEREESLTKEISEQEALRDSLEERQKYVTTNQYIKEVAREKLGLLEPDEVLLKQNEN